jgi:hypothetical protein
MGFNSAFKGLNDNYVITCCTLAIQQNETRGEENAWRKLSPH